jgi:hypothetical protein
MIQANSKTPMGAEKVSIGVLFVIHIPQNRFEKSNNLWINKPIISSDIAVKNRRILSRRY